MEEPKYRSTFHVKASFRKEDFPTGSFVSKASLELEELKALLPDKTEISQNPDLLYACFNAAVANLINLNGDGITTAGAKNLVASCKNKPMNLEHQRSSVVGFITNYGFSSFGENKLLTLDELSDDPFNISLAAIVWKICDRGFANFLKESQAEDGYYYQAISTSWEVGFDSYKLALGSKDLRKAKIIEDEEEVKSYSKYLLSEGGNGFTPEGVEVYRVVGDDCRFLGCAFTGNPAAAVKGVVCMDYMDLEEDEDDREEEDDEEDEEESESKVDEVLQPVVASEASEKINLLKNNEETSLNIKKRVIKRMKYKNTDELIDNLAEAHASDVRDFIVSQVEKANEEFLALKAEKEEKEKALNDAIAAATNFEKQTQELRAEVDQLRASIKAQEDQVKFNERMESLKDQFDIDSAASKTISKKIFGLSDEAFAEWLEEMKPFLKQKQSQDPNLESAASKTVQLPNSTAPEKNKWDDILESLNGVKLV